jgi:hypothetical protein
MNSPTILSLSECKSTCAHVACEHAILTGVMHHFSNICRKATWLSHNASMAKINHAVTLMEAAQGSPSLARLTELTRESSLRLKMLHTLIPGPLRNAVQAGPIEGSEWCLLVNSNAAAAKLRQMLPALQAHLNCHGHAVDKIRLKILPPSA